MKTIILAIILLSSCGPKEPSRLEKMNMAIDSVYKAETEKIRQDSLRLYRYER